MGTLNVTFRGSCTNFRNVLPGIPHRVVLPNGAATRFGLTKFPATDREDWTLSPHLAYICRGTPKDPQLNIPHVIKDGWISRPVSIQIVNATPAVCGPTYTDDCYNCIPQVGAFVEHYQYSPEVVLGGRASAYFDLTSGTITMKKDVNAYQAHATVTTEGDPVIRITTLSRGHAGEAVMTCDVPLDPVTDLTILNLGLECSKAKEGSVDFLLHYLTAAGGIPSNFKKKLPGWDPEETAQAKNADEKPPEPLTPIMCLKELMDYDYPDPERFKARKVLERIAGVIGTHSSCSNSRYP